MTSSRLANLQLMAHEERYFMQQTSIGYGRFYSITIQEYRRWDFGNNNDWGTYGTLGTLENDAYIFERFKGAILNGFR